MRLPLLLALLPVLAKACTKGYDTAYDGQCLETISSSQHYADAKNTCASNDGHLPMLYTKQDADDFAIGYSRSYYVWIGLLCDGEKFVWEDGTVATFTNFEKDEVCNPANINRRYYVYPTGSYKWYSVTDGNASSITPLCVANVRSWICDTYFLLQQGKSDDICYLFDSNLVTMSQAESNCKSQRAHISPIHDQSMNDYVKRMATGHGATNGIHIGLQLVDDRYVWSDGTEMDYANFAPGFPDTSFGECVVMGINLFSGKWMNVECSTTLPYVCTKAALSYDENAVPEGCTKDEYYPGDEVFSPTCGNATGPALCDYALMDLDKSKKVTVEILFFESNSCCDTLTIYDGLAGAKVLKTLTGYSGFTSIKVTGSANAIRMEWNAKSGSHVRGWHAKVTSA